MTEKPAPNVERATRAFLLFLHREAMKRHGLAADTKVPEFDMLVRTDQVMLMSAMNFAIRASTQVAQTESVPA